MTGPGYVVSPSALDATAAGIEAVLSGLRALGPLGMAEEGRGVVTLASLPGDVGVAVTGKLIPAWPSSQADACHTKWL